MPEKKADKGKKPPSFTIDASSKHFNLVVEYALLRLVGDVETEDKEREAIEMKLIALKREAFQWRADNPDDCRPSRASDF